MLMEAKRALEQQLQEVRGGGSESIGRGDYKGRGTGENTDVNGGQEGSGTTATGGLFVRFSYAYVTVCDISVTYVMTHRLLKNIRPTMMGLLGNRHSACVTVDKMCLKLLHYLAICTKSTSVTSLVCACKIL